MTSSAPHLTEGRGLRFGSVCSGIEAASVAWHPLGWRASFLSEIEAFPRAVLAHHYPETPLHGDFTTIRAGEYEPIDLLVGGTPCQSFSVAGLRGGLDDDRGNLALEYLRLADRLRPRWLVWENVPGVLSSNGGRDFGAILGGMVELGYGVAYRVLDAQFFGVAQRRRRVFVVGYAGDWRRAAAVLFERHSLSGHPAPRREKGQSAPTIPSRSSAGGGLGTDFDCDGGLIQAYGGGNTSGPIPVAAALAALAAHGRRQDFEVETFVAHTLKGEVFDASEDGTGRGTPIVPVAYRTTGNDGCYETGDAVGALTQSTDPNAQIIAFSAKDHGADAMSDLSPTLRAGGHSKSHANAGVMPAVAFAIQERAVCENPAAGPDGAGFRSDDAAYTIEARTVPQAVAFSIMPMNSGKDFKGRETDISQPVMAAGPAGGNQGGDYIVQPLAFDTTQITSAANYSNPQPGDPCHPLASGAHAPAIAGSAVRRLTPRECERLQGFPEITNELRILVCKSEDEKRALASSVAKGLAALALGPSAPVAVHVLIDLERQAVQLHSLGRSLLSASIADLASSYRLSMRADAFAHLAALTNAAVANSTRAGKAASPASIRPSSPALNGSTSVVLSGPEIAELAGDAERFTGALSECSKSITSQHGPADQTLGSTLETLSCCVAIAMAGFIPEAMRNACSYEIRISTHHGYTAVQSRGKPAADGPRYKALGNSMAVPVMAWIGRRIAAVEALQIQPESQAA